MSSGQREVGTMLQMSGAVVDIVYRIDALPEAGGEVMATSQDMSAGGGFNAMVAAARAGLKVSYGGMHGTGPFADIVRMALKAEGFDLLRRQVPDQDQGSCIVLVDGDGERSFVSKDGAEGMSGRGFPSIDGGYDWILLSGYTLCYPDSRDALHTWVQDLPDGAGFVFDPSPVVAHIPAPILRDVLAKARCVSCNGREAEAITGIAAPAEAAEALLSAHCPAADCVVVRLGSEGCLVAERDSEPVRIEGFRMQSVRDTNGAGDTHIGAILAAISRGEGWEVAALYANAAAALSTQVSGPATAPAHEETIRFLTENLPEWRQSKSGGAHPGAARTKTHQPMAERF